jgi:hypothetical protein
VRHALAHRVVRCRIGWGECRQTVDVAVEHAERRRNEDGVVNFPVRCAFAAGCLDVDGRDVLAALLHLDRDRQEGAKLLRDWCAGVIAFHGVDERIIATEMMRSGGAVARLAEMTVVARRHERRDGLALAAGQSVGPAQQHFGKLAQRFGGLGTECETAGDARKSLRESDVRHGDGV